MGSKSGKRRRRRERALATTGSGKKNRPTREPMSSAGSVDDGAATKVAGVDESPGPTKKTREPDPAGLVDSGLGSEGETPDTSVPVSVPTDVDESAGEAGPEWSPPPGWKNPGAAVEPMPVIARDEAVSGVATDPPTVARLRSAAPVDSMSLLDRGGGDSSASQAAQRLEERLEGLTAWLANWFESYEDERRQSGLGGGTRRRRLVMAMVAVFFPLIALLGLATRLGWLS